ncbi:MAG: hypothetical protein P1U46_01930 [Patescibacteria group bacterium]|nr:hypothetical protein [Patescibacteria group bacterium]
MIIRSIDESIANLILFCLKSFFVKKNLNIKIIKKTVSISNNIENIILIIFEIKLFISFKFIHNHAKNFTSSTV